MFNKFKEKKFGCKIEEFYLFELLPSSPELSTD